jgi:hypothetical protein
MDNKTIFVRTDKGENEARGKTAHLSSDIKRALLMVDGDATFGEIAKRAAPGLRNLLGELFDDLAKSGFIEDSARINTMPRMVVPAKMAIPLKNPANEGSEGLDFTGIFRPPTPEMMAAETARAQAAKLKEEAETEANQKIEAANLKGQQEAAQARAELEAAAKARALAEVKTRQEIEAANLKAKQVAAAHPDGEQQVAKAKFDKDQAVAEAKARLKAEYEAVQKRAETGRNARQEAETSQVAAQLAKQREAAEAKAREESELRRKEKIETARLHAELEAAKNKAVAEAQARAEAEKLARQEADFARAEIARLKAEAEAARIKAEQEALKAHEEAKQRAREEAEAARLKAQQEAETARLKAQQEAAKAREEAELAKQHAAAEARAREESERRLKEEIEAARAYAELEAARAKAEAEAQARAEAEKLARQEADFARAEVARLKAEADAKEIAEAARLQAEHEAAQALTVLEAARAKAEAEALVQHEAEFARTEAETSLANEAAQLKADQDAAKVREEFEATRQQEEAQQRAQAEADAKIDLQAQQAAEAMLLQAAQDVAQFKTADETVKPKPGADSSARSNSVTVLFFDVVGYTKQSVNKQTKIKKRFNQLLADCLAAQGDGDHIMLDTGDGAAVGFLQHPEEALEVAMQFRKTALAERHRDYPDLKVRVGIHLGPVNIVNDVNGQSNMVGDGINDAQRVMSFAGIDQIYVSRSYYDFISRLNDEYAELFQYRGSLKDKHGREHPVYELMDTAEPAVEAALPHAGKAVAIKLEPFSLIMPEEAFQPSVIEQEPPKIELGTANTGVAEQAGQADKMAAAEPTQQLPPMAMPIETVKSPAKAHMPSEEDVTKLAEEQAKTWAEAEQRAAETLSEERKPKAEDKKPVLKRKLRPLGSGLPWAKISAGLFVALLAALFVIPFVLPTQGYADRVGQLLTARLQQPVHIGRLSGRLLPFPRLELSDVSIGGEKQIQIAQAQMNFALSALFSSVKPIGNLNLEGLKINGSALPQVSTWLQKTAADTEYPVARIELNQGVLEANGIQLSGIAGELNFNQAGKFAQVKLQAEGGKFALDLNATPENKMQMSFTARGIALPLLPNWFFDELNAKGELTGDELVITDFDSHIFGGMLLGNARIDWRSGWHADGMLVSKSITLQNLSKVLGGDLDGSARFRMEAASLDRLAETTTMEGAFVIKKGLINGIDIIETTRLRSRESLPGGRSHFDELSGNLSVANGAYAFRQLRMDAGILKAAGALDIIGPQLSGRISAELPMRAGAGAVTLQVGGTTESPTLRAANY